MAWDEHNNYSNDTLDEVSDRASLLQLNIATIGVEVSLPEKLITWGADCYDKWQEARVKAEVERGERDVAYERYQMKYNSIREFAIRIKAALIGVIKDTDSGEELIDEYGLKGEVSRSRAGLIQFINQIKETHDRLVAASDERVLPDTIITSLSAEVKTLINLWHNTQKERQESAVAYDELHVLKNEYAQKFRAIYSLAVIMKGKYSPVLLLLGFAPATPPAGHGQPNNPEGLTVNFEEPVLTISWNPCENTTNYQLKYSLNGENWEEIYMGDVSSYGYEPPLELRYYRVRARNKNGYSNWSNVVEFDPATLPDHK